MRALGVLSISPARKVPVEGILGLAFPAMAANGAAGGSGFWGGFGGFWGVLGGFVVFCWFLFCFLFFCFFFWGGGRQRRQGPRGSAGG